RGLVYVQSRIPDCLTLRAPRMRIDTLLVIRRVMLPSTAKSPARRADYQILAPANTNHPILPVAFCGEANPGAIAVSGEDHQEPLAVFCEVRHCRPILLELRLGRQTTGSPAVGIYPPAVARWWHASPNRP